MQNNESIKCLVSHRKISPLYDSEFRNFCQDRQDLRLKETISQQRYSYV
jgi:hypothetical protein